jgi:hypothetical protein
MRGREKITIKFIKQEDNRRIFTKKYVDLKFKLNYYCLEFKRMPFGGFPLFIWKQTDAGKYN